MNGAVGGVRSLLRLVLVLGGHRVRVPVVIGIDYRPLVAAPPHRRQPAASVVLQVRNVRGGERGGQTERVGTIYNYSQGMYAARPQYDGGRSTPPPRTPSLDTVRAAHHRCA